MRMNTIPQVVPLNIDQERLVSLGVVSFLFKPPCKRKNVFKALAGGYK